MRACLGVRLVLLAGWACSPAAETAAVPRSTLFVGIDVSGSFQTHGRFEDALAFAAHYIRARLEGAGGLEVPRHLFVGSVGGDVPGQPHAFRPVHDFRGKTVEDIEADLREWFRPRNQLTDFNAFFDRVAALARRQNLVLAPITVVLLSDGEPDLGADANDDSALYHDIDLAPLEYLARNVTVRLLYPEPTVAVHWENDVPRSRVRLWTVDRVVMQGWREQLQPGDSSQEPLWHWMAEVVDFRVRRGMI